MDRTRVTIVTSSSISPASKQAIRTGRQRQWETTPTLTYNELSRVLTTSDDPRPLGIQLSAKQVRGHCPAFNPAVTHPPPMTGIQLIRQWEVTRKSFVLCNIEAGMVATDSTHHHSTNRTNLLKLLQDVRIISTIHSPRTVTASPQSTISWSQGQSTLHCNLATKLQCSNARVTSSSVTHQITNKQRLNEAKHLELASVCNNIWRNNSNSNNKRFTIINNPPAMHTAYQLQRLTLTVIEVQAKNTLTCNSNYVQKSWLNISCHYNTWHITHCCSEKTTV